MDKVVSSAAALGVPSLILITAISASGFVGAAGLTTALAALGPGGMLGGLLTLGIIGLISKGLTEFGFDAVFSSVVRELVRRGETLSSIDAKIDKYPISPTLKRKLNEDLSKIELAYDRA